MCPPNPHLPPRREYQAAKDPQTNRVAYGPELPESQHAAKLRRLVVALEAPRFAAADPTQPDPTPPGMNSEQHEAVRRVLRARDYALVLGMPGAGKTTTIVSMVQALVAQGKRVLLTSYTNRQGGLPPGACARMGRPRRTAYMPADLPGLLRPSAPNLPLPACSAVDNILMKLAGEEVPFVRLGRLASVHPAVRPWTPGGERYPLKATRELARLADSVPVVSVPGAWYWPVWDYVWAGAMFGGRASGQAYSSSQNVAAAMRPSHHVAFLLHRLTSATASHEPAVWRHLLWREPGHAQGQAV